VTSRDQVNLDEPLSQKSHYVYNELSPIQINLLKLENFAEWCVSNVDSNLDITFSETSLTISGVFESVDKVKIMLIELVQNMTEEKIELSSHFTELRLLNSISECLNKRHGLVCSLEPSEEGTLIRCCNQTMITKCVQLIRDEFSIYEHFFVTDAGLQLISGSKFRKFLLESEKELNKENIDNKQTLIKTSKIKLHSFHNILTLNGLSQTVSLSLILLIVKKNFLN